MTLPAILINRLTDKEVRNAIPHDDKPAMLPDGQGLYLQITPSKTAGNPPARSGVFLYRNVEGKKTLLGLGSTRHVSCRGPRACEKQRDLLDNGIDSKSEKLRLKAAVVSDYKKQKEADNAKKAAMSFNQAAIVYMEEKTAQKRWSNKAHIFQWKASLGLTPSKMLCRVSETLANLPVTDIDQDDVLSLVKPLWHQRPVSASRLRNRIELVLGHWAANNKIPGTPWPAESVANVSVA